MPSTSTPTSSPLEPYHIKHATEEDAENILAFLKRFFFKDEPLNKSIQLIASEDERCYELEQFSSRNLPEGISLLAVTTSGEIIGVCINGILNRNDSEAELECSNQKFSKILKLITKVDKEANVFGRFPDINKILSVNVLSVDSAWRGKGIAKSLMDKARTIARERGCDLMKVDCSSHFTARAVAKLGFECIYSLKYADYKEDGKSVFNPEEPHKEARTYIHKLSL